jgi:hypothetical protein
MNRTLSNTLVLSFLFQALTPIVHAEQLSLQAPDIEPPLILFDAGDSEITDGTKTFSAKVTDNRGVANVILYYKKAGDVAFQPKVMKKQGNDIYSTDLSVDSMISKRLEVYIRADDISGNSVFEGQKFSPFAYAVVPATGAKGFTPGGRAAEDENDEEEMSTLTKVLLGLGVLVLVGGSGGGGGETSSGNITITTELPD